MRKMIRSFSIAVLLGFFTVSSTQLPPEISAWKTCAGKPIDSICWMALVNYPECYIWNPDLAKDGTGTWSGECSGGLVQGKETRINNQVNRFSSG